MESASSLSEPPVEAGVAASRFLDDKRSYPFHSGDLQELVHMLEDRIWTLAAEGKLEEAERTVQGAVLQAQQTIEDEGDEIAFFELAHGLELYADLLRAHGNLNEARTRFGEALQILSDKPGHELQQGRIHVQLATIADEAGKPVDAIQHYLQAIGLLNSGDPAPQLDVADISNNVAFLLREVGRTEEAEDLYTQALEIYQTLLGRNAEETATLSNNLGSIHFMSGRYEDAKQMQMMALDGRRELLGKEHPDTAQTHGNLAATLTELGELDAAEKHYKIAIEILNEADEEFLEDLDVVTTNFEYFKTRFGR